MPYSPRSDETITHWAQLPTLPGRTTHLLLGDDALTALRNTWDARSAT
ncbi:hypothetical protein [Streptomyces tagetis]|nr:hypothetical protein [Streptomyces sp. RG38]